MIAARHSALQRDLPARRILIALGASLLVHFLLVSYQGGSGAIHSAAIVPAPLQARLELTPEALLPPAEAEIPPLMKPFIEPLIKPLATPVTTAKQPAAPLHRLPVATAVAAQPLPAGAGASGPDLRFYLARELDQYPSPLSALSLDNDRGTAGSARLWVSIDQAGQVVDAAVIDADPPGEFERLARDRVLATRFVPAQRDGRAVKSRVLLVLRQGA